MGRRRVAERTALVNRKVISIVCRYGIGLGLLAFVVIWYWHVPTPDGGPDVGLATALQDRVIGLCGLFWLVTLLGSMLHFVLAEDGSASPEAPFVLRTILLTAAGLSLGSLIVWLGMGWVSEPWAERMALRLHQIPKIGTALAELWRAGWLYRRRGTSVTLALGLSLLGHCCFVMSFFCAAHV